MNEELKEKVRKVLNDFIKLYKFPAEIFLDIFKTEVEGNKLKVYIKIDPSFKFEFPIITPADFVVLLQRFTPQPYGKLENMDLYFYFVLGEVEKKAQVEPEQPSLNFQAQVLVKALDEIAKPVVESGIPDLMLGWFVAKNVARSISQMFEHPDVVVGREEGRMVVYPR